MPQGYLRLLIFNRDSALVGQQVQQLTSAALGGYEPLRLQVVLPQDGYVTAYVGNESDVDVFFDDVSVEHRPGLQVQETHYDAAGLELAGLAPPSPGLRGLNNYRFNGKEFQTDLGLNWNHQDWRFLDPTTLHWNGLDPEVENGQESWSPYSFGFDNAVRYADSNGREPNDPPIRGDLLNRIILGVGVSVVNLQGQMWAGILGTKTKYAADYVYDSQGEAVDYKIFKTAVGTDAQELKSMALDELSLLSLGIGGGEGKLTEQAAGKVAVAEVKATSLPTLKQGSAEWKAAAKDIAQGGKTASNYRTQTATEAKQLMNEGRGGLTRYKQYSPAGKSAKKGFEMHPNESGTKNAPHNDLPHVKWKDWLSEHNSGDGHIFFNKPN